MTGCVCVFVCPDLSAPKPLDQSKNVTVRLITICERKKMGEKNWPKSAKKRQKEPKFDFSAPELLSVPH